MRALPEELERGRDVHGVVEPVSSNAATGRGSRAWRGLERAPGGAVVRESERRVRIVRQLESLARRLSGGAAGFLHDSRGEHQRCSSLARELARRLDKLALDELDDYELDVDVDDDDDVDE